MGSTALAGWFGVRAERLDELVALPQRATGSTPGRRYGTSEFNRTLVTALVAQFQGFVRELHDLAMNEFVRTIEPPSRRDVVHSALKQGRRLDVQTPRRDHLGFDFGRSRNGLARTLDGVLAAQLASLLGTDPPW